MYALVNKKSSTRIPDSMLTDQLRAYLAPNYEGDPEMEELASLIAAGTTITLEVVADAEASALQGERGIGRHGSAPGLPQIPRTIELTPGRLSDGP